ncbi:alpha/beta hydrolase [Inquilinus sp. CAU 1745]|uniref:alpha/beta hydrolase n=1 Tax=Inquilinus sp. CAU 1745 TaxID=3140369 RepID=UPI00325B0AB2
MSLHPESLAYVKAVDAWLAERSLPPLHRMGPAKAREIAHEVILEDRPPLEPVDWVEDHMVPARSGPRRVRIVKPRTAHGCPLPVALYFHGGGYVIGGIDESEHEARRLAQRLPALVVSASYRLAPEHPFPAAVEDGYDALMWIAHHAHAYGGDARRIMVGGCSAGAGLAAAVTRLSVTENGPPVALNYLLCPWLDLTLDEPSVDEHAEGTNLTREELDWFARCYLGTTGQPGDPLISPSLHAVPRGMPPTVILAAECDPLRDEAARYAEALRDAGTEVVHHVAPGMIHGFNMLLHAIPEGDRHVKQAEAAIRRLARG